MDSLWDFWTEADRDALMRANQFDDLAQIATAVIKRMPCSVVEVCGPLTTGGRGSFMENLAVFVAVTNGLKAQGRIVFDLQPFEPKIQEIIVKWKETNRGYCWPIMEIFYRQIFNTDLITAAYFIPGWDSSVGAQWERRYFESKNTKIYDLSHEEVEHYMKQA